MRFSLSDERPTDSGLTSSCAFAATANSRQGRISDRNFRFMGFDGLSWFVDRGCRLYSPLQLWAQKNSGPAQWGPKTRPSIIRQAGVLRKATSDAEAADW